MGAGRRGVDMGPSALRLADLFTKLAELKDVSSVTDTGNIHVPTREEMADAGELDDKVVNARNHRPIGAAVASLTEVVEDIVTRGSVPLVLGGDHSLAAGSMSGTQRARVAAGQAKAGLLWIDAHMDMNTPETSPSGNLHGMPLAALLGLEVPGLSAAVGGPDGMFDPSRVACVGIRDVDPAERDNMAKLGLIEDHNVFTMSSIDRHGMANVMERALNIIAPGVADSFAVSFDADSLDPSVAPGVGTPVPGGISFREGHLIMEMLARHGGMCGLDVVEVNPVLDTRNATAKVAVQMVLSAFGQTTL
ncbi:arginase [Thecamonas trahens ATCC 50062]|uniref:Arginase n=1 Tax=Thecamonas trahens ATCC 50062 TaxID=461836 RepID=A0A0L0D619_THETB|nr:arginase [Thecamonas trahens ATCC 50062]KNC46758.1 arginase [Thecamonas trahens ATCC 50062]|eukprot:XP_013760038.1 arginase [Thecamonas trahens ATCC 50062]